MALREFQLDSSRSFADYFLFLDGKACGVIEAEEESVAVSSPELQSNLYAEVKAARLEHVAAHCAQREGSSSLLA